MASVIDEIETVASEKSAAPRKRMTVFRANDGVELDHERMPFLGIDETAMAGFGKMMATGVAPGLGEKAVLLFSEPGEDGLSLSYAWFKSGYVLPRHSHNADCVYYVLGGELRMGSVTLRKGDGVFIPADDGYTYDVGPDGVEVLEFRNATRFHIHFKGNDEAHWDWMAKVYEDRGVAWAGETVPPSDR